MTDPGKPAPVAPFVLPRLPFDWGALAPVIDAESLRVHHDVIHRAHVDAVNAALVAHPELHGRTIEDLLRHLHDLPADIRETMRREGGGHANHQFFWKILTPNGPGRPSGDLLAAIERDFGSFEAFQAAFEGAGTRHFGSGWVFLVARPKQDFRLEIQVLPNDESVLFEAEPAPGLLACDLWEHAYYGSYRNRRADWLEAWWRVVHWDYVGERLQGIREGRKQL